MQTMVQKTHQSEILLKKMLLLNLITASCTVLWHNNQVITIISLSSNTNAFVFKLQQLNSSLSDTVVKTTVLIVL